MYITRRLSNSISN